VPSPFYRKKGKFMEENKMINHRFYRENAPFPNNRLISFSKRFVDGEGKPIHWEIKSLCQREQEGILQDCKQKERNGKRSFNMTEYEGLLLGKSVIFPDLDDVVLQDSYGVFGARGLLEKMLTAGEYQELLLQAMDISR